MLGPHFYYDLIRIARKGRTTLLRCLYLLALLVGVWVVYDEHPGRAADRNVYAVNAQNIAVTVIVLQYVVVLVVTPVYVCGAIVEEKKRRTLDLLFTTQLTNVELVCGKLGARFAHLAGVVLASLPLLVFVQFFWGGLDMEFLTFHYVHALLVLALASSACMWTSTEFATHGEALFTAYSLMVVLGVASAVVSTIPQDAWLLGTAGYLAAYLLMIPCYLGGAALFTWLAVRRVRDFYLVLMASGHIAEQPTSGPKRRARRRRVVRAGTALKVHHVARNRSRIHRLAWPIRGHALLWKECRMDGDDFSLAYRWVVHMVFTAGGFCVAFWIVHFSPLAEWRQAANIHGFAYLGANGLYCLGMASYAVWTLVRVTGTMVREREQNTLDFLLLLPIARSEILLCKWLGSLWRPWPCLAIAYTGVLLGLCCGLYGPGAAAVLVLAPWPLLLMLSLLGLLLSVSSRRVLTANVTMACSVVALFIGHLLLCGALVPLVHVYASVVSEQQGRFADGEWERGAALAVIQQVAFLWFAGCFGAVAFFRFETCRSEPRGLAW